ncbi:MAG: signal peptidase I [Pseudomonadota bacterium]|nr:signal peptidase I [Pseudomonadota bacterium]
MDLDLPLILVLAVFATGGIWLLDFALLAPRRRARVAAHGGVIDPEASEAEALAKEPGWVEQAKAFFPILLLVLVLRSFLVEPFQIPSSSMVPTLEIGDFILVNKFAYGLRLPVVGTKVVPIGAPERGDVMVFRPPHQPDTNFIKRVVGLPGDTVTYADKQLFVNGEAVAVELLAALPVGRPQIKILEEQLGEAHHLIQVSIGPSPPGRQWQIPEGHYFVMGDNRDNSSDSRVWGFVSEDAVVGKAFAVWLHWPRFWSLPSFSRNRMIE